MPITALEILFADTARSLGWTVADARAAADAEELQVIVWGTDEKPTATYLVKVTDDTAEKGEEVWVNIRNAEGTADWLYGSADLIAFDLGDRFVLVERTTLVDWVKENVDKEYVDRATLGLMKIVTRVDDKSMRTLIKTFHLKGLAMGEMKYG